MFLRTTALIALALIAAPSATARQAPARRVIIPAEAADEYGLSDEDEYSGPVIRRFNANKNLFYALLVVSGRFKQHPDHYDC